MSNLAVNDLLLIHELISATEQSISSITGMDVKLDLKFVVDADIYGNNRLTPKEILTAVANETEVEVAQILGHNRNRNVVEARCFAIAIIADKYPEFTLKGLGRLFNRDHSTIIHAKASLVDWLATEKPLRNKFEALKQKLQDYLMIKIHKNEQQKQNSITG